MPDAILSFCKCSLDFILFFWFSTQFFSQQLKKYKVYSYVVLLVLSIVIYCVNFMHFPYLNTATAIICAFILNFLLFKGHSGARLLVSIVEVLLIVICEFIPISIYSYIDKINMAALTNETIKDAGFNLISTGLFSVIIIIVRHIIVLKKQRNNKDITITENIAIITVPLVSIFIVYYILFIQSSIAVKNEKLPIHSIFVFLGILIMNIVVIMGDNNLRQQYHLQRELDRLHRLEQLNRIVIEQQDQYLEELKGFAHDYAKQIDGIKNLASVEEIMTTDAIQKYSKEMFAQIQENYRFAFIPSPALRTILSQAQMHCHTHRIEFDVKIEYADFSFVAFPDLYSIFENPLDNAITACKQITDDGIQKKIKLTMFRKRNMIWFTLNNPMVNPIIIKNNNIQTTKKNSNKHGFGIKNMKRVVTRYGGYINIEYTGNEFCISVALPAPAE